MSEAEKKRRRDYKENRKKRIMLFSAILCGLLLLTTVFGLVYNAMDKTLFVAYSETSNINYSVKLFPNPYYEGEWQAPGQSYVSELTDTVKVDIDYAVSVDEDEIEYFHTYEVTANLVVADKISRVPIYHPVDVVVTPVTATISGDNAMEFTVFVDYADYRAKAAEFIDAYALSSVDAYISVNLHVDTVGNRTYAMPKGYDATLKLPLIERTFRPETTSSVPTSAMQYLECESGVGVVVFHVLTIIFGVLSVLGAAFLVGFIYLTRNHDINYAIRVKRLIATYKSFIQEMTTPFATEGYQLVYIKNFNEMLEVRDTVGAPLLMYENADATATSFVIPASSGILYCYEIRVEDYNDIYGIADEEEMLGTADAKTCFAKSLWNKICAFFRSLKKKPAPTPAVAEAEAAEGEVTEGEVTEGEATEGEATEGEVTEGEATEGEVTEGETTEGEAIEGEATEGEVTEGEATEGEATEATDAPTEEEPAETPSENAAEEQPVQN